MNDRMKNVFIAIGWIIIGCLLIKNIEMFRHQEVIHNHFIKVYNKAETPPGIARFTGGMAYFFLPFLIGYPISIFLHKKYSSSHGKWLAMFLTVFVIARMCFILL
jgi:hypothetical protein